MKKLRFVLGVMLVACLFVLNGCGGGGGGSGSGVSSVGGGTPAPSGAPPVVTAFSTNGSTGVITGSRIAITVPYGTDPSALVAKFINSAGVVSINGVPQVSGVTTNDFTKPVSYTVTQLNSSSKTASAKAAATDATTSTTYTATVTVASFTDNSITAFSVNAPSSTTATSGIISVQNISVLVPAETDVTAMTTTFSTSGASVTANGVTQVSGVTTNDFTNPVTFVVAAASRATQSYKVSVVKVPVSSNDMIQFSLNGTPGVISSGGTSQSIVVKVPFGTNPNGLVASFISTGTSVTVGNTTQVNGQTQNDFTNPVTYTVTAENGATQNYTVSVIVSSSSSNFMNAFSFGNIQGEIVGQNIGVTVPAGTNVTGLVASFITTGTNVTVNGVTQTSSQTANNFTNPVTYTVVAADGSTSNYTVIVNVAASASSSITAFSFGTEKGVITGTNIAVTMPAGTDVTNLIATFTTTGVSVKVGTVTQISGSTNNNFSSPLSYIVTAADGSTTTYTVTVTVALSSAKAITAYAIAGVTGVITNFNIAVTVPFGTNPTALVATFTTTGTNVTVNGTNQFSGTTTNNFSTPVTYLVTAANGSTQSYVVTVTVAGSPAKAITSFIINGYSGTISGLNILVKIQFGTSLIGLTPVFTSTGANVSVNGITQVSNSSSQNFTSPVAYLVTAADGSSNTYTVTVDNTGNVWTWMSGSNDLFQYSVYGTVTVTNPSNLAGNRQSGTSWTDNSGNLWFFGGEGYSTTSTYAGWSDLWQYNISTGYWTWMSGPNIIYQDATYGTLGVADPSNIPSNRFGSIPWTDNSGNLWLFGGRSTSGPINDLWKYNISTGYWTWMGGESSTNSPGIYNTLGVANPTNVPGAREGSVSWVDNSGKLWLFGGNGVDSANASGSLNDLWKFDPTIGPNGEWTWMGGSNTVNHNGVYGTRGVPSTSNIPGGRQYAISWIDSSGNFWLFGGFGRASVSGNGSLNDLWKYNPSTGEWTWVSGPNTRNGVATYGTRGVPSTSNIPGSRQNSCSWIDASGNLWLFSGSGKGNTNINTNLNDVWKFNPSTGEWTWVSGTDVSGAASGVYGTMGVPDASNMPGTRYSSICWVDQAGDFWVFGGSGYPLSGSPNGTLADLWRYHP